MVENLNHILNGTPFFHINVLFLLGLALFGGAIGGRIFQKLKIPQVVGYIIIGVIIGQSGFRIVDAKTVELLKPFNYFALGLIGFMVGGDLKKEILLKYGKHFLYILLCEGVAPFLLVSIFAGVIGIFIFGNPTFAWSLALLLGAIASATDPATTTSVLKEYKTRGPLSTNILGIVALDDGLALFLFAIASSIGWSLTGYASGNILSTFLHPIYEIGGAVIIGILSGFILNKLLVRYGEKDRILAFTVGTVLLVTGLSVAVNVSMLLAVMTLGIMIVNLIPQKSKEAFNLVEGFTPPIYVLFFVLVGAKLKFSHMTPVIIIFVLVYLLFGMSGKFLGAYIGSRLSRAPKTVTKYLPFSLFSQGGIAIGLSILVAQKFSGDIGDSLVIIITATTFVTQILGPPFTKFAVSRAGEVGLNITEEDITRQSIAEQFMDKNPPIIREDMQLSDILKVFSENDNLYYPVVNKDKKLRGIITVDGIRQTFLETDIGGLILANDLMQPVVARILPDASAQQVKDILERYDIEYLPVVDKEETLVGFIEQKKFNKSISTRIIELQKKVDFLEES